MSSLAINKCCPRSGLTIQPDSLTTYRGQTVGFCNPVCRNELASDPASYPSDCAYFDTLIKELILPILDSED